MLKYRRLHVRELESLEQKFIQFLVSNTITGDDWLKIKTQQPERAEGLIEIFSNLVFDEALKKVNYLKLGSKNDLKIFRFGESFIQLLGLAVNHPSKEIDFYKQHDLAEIVRTNEHLSIYHLEKKYAISKEHDAFFLMEQGCLICDGSDFEILELLYLMR